MKTLTEKELCDLISFVASLVLYNSTPTEDYIIEWCEENSIVLTNNVVQHIIDVVSANLRNK